MFIVRSFSNGEQVVVLQYAAAFYWLMWPVILLTVISSIVESTAVNVATGIAWLFLLAVAVPYWPVVLKLKRQMRGGEIVATGSKYSFTNPLTYRWKVAEKTDLEL